MATDAVRTIGSSIVQHGHHNRRVYVMKISRNDIPDIIRPLDELAQKDGCSKIFIKVPESAMPAFAGAGYVTEAVVPFFFNGQEPAAFMAKYFDAQRKEAANTETLADVLSVAFGYAGAGYRPELPPGLSVVHAHPGNAKEISALFSSLFATYPFPVFDPEYIAHAMKEGVRYFCIHHAKRIVAVASCEADDAALNAEMTDFATDTAFQGKGLAGFLLHAMETEAKRDGIRLAYTIARAQSYPINITFARAGYEYAGMLPNNTNIGGGIESMNVWYRKL